MNRRNKYKDMQKWYNTKKAQQIRYYGKTAFAPQHHKFWSEEDRRKVWAHEIPDNELAEQIGRSVGAIQMMRNNMKQEMGEI